MPEKKLARSRKESHYQRTTRLYTHVLQRGGLAVRSPLDVESRGE